MTELPAAALSYVPPAPPGAVALTPAEFLAWARGQLPEHRGRTMPPPWQPGQHLALLGKTREGKTNLAVWLCAELRRFVMALDR